MSNNANIVMINLRKIREAKGLSQCDLAKILGVGSSNHVGQFEDGKAVKPHTACVVAKALQVSTKKLCGAKVYDDTVECEKARVMHLIGDGYFARENEIHMSNWQPTGARRIGGHDISGDSCHGGNGQ